MAPVIDSDAGDLIDELFGRRLLSPVRYIYAHHIAAAECPVHSDTGHEICVHFRLVRADGSEGLGCLDIDEAYTASLIWRKRLQWLTRLKKDPKTGRILAPNTVH